MKAMLKVFSGLCFLTLVSCGASSAASAAKPADSAPSASDAGKTLVVYNWVAYVSDDVIKKFEKDFGVTVDYQTFASNEEMYTKLQSGGAGYDVVFPSQDYVSIMIKNKMVEPIGKDAVANFKNIDPVALKMNEGANAYDPGFVYSVPYNFGAAGILVNKTKLKNYPQSWAIFDMPEVKGKGIMLDDMREVLGAALSFKGYSVSTREAKEIDAAKAVIKGWKKNINKFDADKAAIEFAKGEWTVMQFYPENVVGNFEDPADWDKTVDFFHAKEGGPAYVDSMVIPKGSKNKDLAIKFINFLLTPEVSAMNGDSLRLPFIVRAADALRTTKPIYTLESIAGLGLKNDVGDALKLYEAAWDEIKQ